MVEVGTADEQLIVTAISTARAAGVGEREIAQVLREAAREPDDEFRVPILAGRLLVLARL